jgi:hypothetical protein
MNKRNNRPLPKKIGHAWMRVPYLNAGTPAPLCPWPLIMDWLSCMTRSIYSGFCIICETNDSNPGPLAAPSAPLVGRPREPNPVGMAPKGENGREDGVAGEVEAVAFPCGCQGFGRAWLFTWPDGALCTPRRAANSRFRSSSNPSCYIASDVSPLSVQ